MAKRPSKKIRADFRKNRNARARTSDWSHLTDDLKQEQIPREERISGKGELTRKRTIIAPEPIDPENASQTSGEYLRGRVTGVFGLASEVETEDGTLYRCATRRILKTLSTDLRHVVATGDIVVFRPTPDGEGIIESVEPRHSVVRRASRGRQHVLVANVDQLVIVASAAEPYLKPNLIDRFLVCAEQEGVRAIVCINKVDLVDIAALEPLVGVYSQMGYRVLMTSTRTGVGIDRLRRTLTGRQSVVSGQSGVGKSSLLNAVDPGFDLRIRTVSAESQKGRHTTTTARLLRLSCGGYVVDTPGIRQFELWDVIPDEVAGFFRDLRPFVSRCRYPDCTHTHEESCAVKDAVADDLVDERRYESYCHMISGGATRSHADEDSDM